MLIPSYENILSWHSWHRLTLSPVLISKLHAWSVHLYSPTYPASALLRLASEKAEPAPDQTQLVQARGLIPEHGFG